MRFELIASTERRLAYVDTSALLKLVVREPETDALRFALRSWPRRVSSEITIVELHRAARRRGDALDDLVRDLLSGVALQRLDRGTIMFAAQVGDPSLRALDAIHLASALRLRPVSPVVFTYDQRLKQAAGQHGLQVLSPA